jgi:tetratricopeptide (TPR) repeat protein
VLIKKLAIAALAAAIFPHTAVAAWNEARSKHFIIYSEQKPEQLRRYAEQLERFDAAVRQVRGMEDPALSDAGRVTIYMLRNQRSVALMVGNPASSVAGFYIGRASGPIAFAHREDARDDSELGGQMVFLHEYLHHLLLSETDLALPPWLVEGSAELFATAQFKKDGSIAFGAVPQHRGYGLFNLSGLSFEQLLNGTTGKIDSEQWESIYGRGWLLSHYLTFGAAGRRGQLGRYVSGIQQGKTGLDSARLAFGDLKQLDRDLERYKKQNRFNGLVVSGSSLRISPVQVRALAAGENAILPIRMKSERGVDKEQAKDLAKDARQVAARFPSDPEVLASLAEAEHDAGNDAAAIAAADRSLTVSPNHHRSMIMKSRALLTLAEKEPAKADWKAIRALISRANRMDPEDAEPLMLFYRSFAVQGAAPTPNAVKGLLYAQLLVPQDDDLRFMAVQQLINDSKLGQARRMFGPIAYSPHAGKSRGDMAKVMDALAANDAKAARTLLEKIGKEEDKS